MRAERVRLSDVAEIAAVAQACREFAAPTAYPAPTDVPSLFAETSSRDNARCWRGDDGSLLAWALAQEEFGNVLFDVLALARPTLTATVVETARDLLRAAGCDGADTPLESDDAWRGDALRGLGFAPEGPDVIHLLNSEPHAHGAPALSADVEVVGNAGDLDAYVAAHRLAFGTTYLTRARRAAWADEPGYDEGLDLGLRLDGAIVAFAVSYLHGGEGEIGTVGVVPEHRGRGLGEAVAGVALAALAARGADTVSMSTSAANGPMLAVATALGFREVRRTQWLHCDLTGSPSSSAAPRTSPA